MPRIRRDLVVARETFAAKRFAEGASLNTIQAELRAGNVAGSQLQGGMMAHARLLDLQRTHAPKGAVDTVVTPVAPTVVTGEVPTTGEVAEPAAPIVALATVPVTTRPDFITSRIMSHTPLGAQKPIPDKEVVFEGKIGEMSQFLERR
jgi:hypothetical protein